MSEQTRRDYVRNTLTMVFTNMAKQTSKKRDKQRQKQQNTEMPENRKNVATGVSKRVTIT